MFLRLIAFVCLGLFVPQFALAQDSGSGSSDFRVFVGHILPNQIDGVSEIMPVFGGSYTAIFGGGGGFELGGSNVHAEGVDFSTLTGSLVGEVAPAPDLAARIYLGADLNYYRPLNESARKTETGVHFGTAALLHATNTLWLRADLKMMGGPGTSLWLLFSLVFR